MRILYNGQYIVIWILVFIEEIFTVYTYGNGDTCYCLQEELSSLRNPLHIEATRLNGQNIYMLGEQLGIIYMYKPSAADEQKLTVYVDITDRVICKPELYEERGLLGFALHPKFESNQKLYIYSIRSYQNKEYAVISEITNKDISREVILLLIEQPGTKRNGGQLLFGDDGYLYMSVGDGGPSSNQNNQAQNGNSFLGKVLRIDVDSSTIVDDKLRYYDIPRDNPKRKDWRPEVYAVGTRNMWRCSKDTGDTAGRGAGRIFCGDLGTSKADELIELKKGGNYGWPYWEGTICRNTSLCNTVDETVSPIYELRRDDKQNDVRAVVGGPLYRGGLFPELYGRLVFGDYTDGKLFTLKEPTTVKSNWTSHDFLRCDKSTCPCNARASQRTMLLSFGQTHGGEILVLMTDEPTPNKPKGALLKLAPKKSDDVTCGAHIGYPSLFITLTCSISLYIHVYLCSSHS